ncbi:hypothetical protein [Pyxidicoccus caerfyrddinensis]|uniref:hypothetical protein n=1 Tax=Pyxidicoccus caerfyrddinensis TaxID=2709663 RepID=UPI0013DACEAE|nr:hypothetical protein [Pyxidicoccus caerfyrddinensis]
MKRLSALFLVLVLGACATTSKKSSLEALKGTVESFHQVIRWRDYRSAARFIVPERREDFQRARIKQNDDQDLTVTDYEIEDVKLSEDGQRATVQSRIQWMRLPSASARTALVTSEFVLRNGAWLLERQLEGPFEGELP